MRTPASTTAARKAIRTMNLRQGTKDDFYAWRCSVRLDTTNALVRYNYKQGINTGVTTTLGFNGDVKKARAFIQRLVKQKLKKGYKGTIPREFQPPQPKKTNVKKIGAKKSMKAPRKTQPKTKKKSSKTNKKSSAIQQQANLTVAIDPAVANINADVAQHGNVVSHTNGGCFHAHLALVDPSNNVDKFYYLQLLHHNGNYFLLQRFGKNGTNGTSKLASISSESEAIERFNKVFKLKTGYTWDDKEKSSATPRTGSLYQYMVSGEAAPGNGRWQYYLQNDPDRKPNGWYNYDPAASTGVEQMYTTYIHNPASMSVRVVQSTSSGFSYMVDLKTMNQKNTTTNKMRPIRRV
eukprot:m.270001 g.270001  ORF g.270001 m.270001 type:complete len:350 (-) comp16261_c0_seq4:138-1187(-)